MKPKIILGILVAAAGLAVLLVTLRSRSVAPGNPASTSVISGQAASAVSSAITDAAGVAVPEGSALATLSDSIDLLVILKPRNVDAALARWDALKSKVTSTAVWKKLNAGAQLEQQFREGLQKNPGGPTPEKLEASWTEFVQRWKGLEEAAVAVSSHTTPVKVREKEIAVPGFLLNLSFSSADAASKGFTELRTAILEDKDRKESPNATILKKGENELELIVKNPEQQMELHASLRLEGKSLRAMYGGTDADFFSADGTRRLVDSSQWKNAGALSSESSALFAYLDTQKLADIVDKLVLAIPADAGEPNTVKDVQRMIAMYRDFETLKAGVDLTDGMRVTSCVLPKAGSTFDSLYANLFGNRAARGKPLLTLTPSLLDSETIAAAGLSLDAVNQSFESVMKQIRGAYVGAEDAQIEKNIDDLLNAVQRAIERLKLQEVGFFVAPPLMPPIIGAGAILGGSELKGDELLKQVAVSLNEISSAVQKAAGNAAIPDIAKVEKNSEGVSELKLSLGGLILVGEVAKESSVIISIDSSIVDMMRKRLEKGGNYFEKYKAPTGLPALVAEADYFFYLGTTTFIDLGRGFVPLLLAQQPQEPKVTASDADEILNMLKFSYLSFQSSYRGQEHTVCSDSRAFVLE